MLLLDNQQEEFLPLSQPLTDEQVSKAWEWLVWALEQPPGKRVPPDEFKKLDRDDWLILLEELNLTYKEQREHLLQ
jgi:hypothetical protein